MMSVVVTAFRTCRVVRSRHVDCDKLPRLESDSADRASNAVKNLSHRMLGVVVTRYYGRGEYAVLSWQIDGIIRAKETDCLRTEPTSRIAVIVEALVTKTPTATRTVTPNVDNPIQQIAAVTQIFNPGHLDARC